MSISRDLFYFILSLLIPQAEELSISKVVLGYCFPFSTSVIFVAVSVSKLLTITPISISVEDTRMLLMDLHSM